MERVIDLKLRYISGDIEDYLHPVVLLDKSELILIDCGCPQFLTVIEEAFQREALDIKLLTKLIITHQDYDHMGSLAELKEKYPNLQIIAGTKESPYISGNKKSLRLEQAEKLQQHLPENEKTSGEAFCEILRNVKFVPVDITVKDGDYFDWCGGCKILETPGHTPGHISLYLPKYKTVITGDAAVIVDQKLSIANPHFTLDMKSAAESLIKLLEIEADTYICYHGGIYNR